MLNDIFCKKAFQPLYAFAFVNIVFDKGSILHDLYLFLYRFAAQMIFEHFVKRCGYGNAKEHTEYSEKTAAHCDRGKHPYPREPKR